MVLTSSWSMRPYSPPHAAATAGTRTPQERPRTRDSEPFRYIDAQQLCARGPALEARRVTSPGGRRAPRSPSGLSNPWLVEPAGLAASSLAAGKVCSVTVASPAGEVRHRHPHQDVRHHAPTSAVAHQRTGSCHAECTALSVRHHPPEGRRVSGIDARRKRDEVPAVVHRSHVMACALGSLRRLAKWPGNGADVGIGDN